MNTVLINYLDTLPAGSVWTVVILAVIIAPWITRARSRVVRFTRTVSWIVLGVVIGLAMRDFLPLAV